MGPARCCCLRVQVCGWLTVSLLRAHTNCTHQLTLRVAVVSSVFRHSRPLRTCAHTIARVRLILHCAHDGLRSHYSLLSDITCKSAGRHLLARSRMQERARGRGGGEAGTHTRMHTRAHAHTCTHTHACILHMHTRTHTCAHLQVVQGGILPVHVGIHVMVTCD